MSIVVGYDTEHESDERLAQELVQCLCAAYPGHAWFVLIRGGIVQIKDMDIHPSWGMALHYTQMKDDPNARRAQVLRAAGEFLERANLRRGKKEDEAPRVTAVEGIADKWLSRAKVVG